MTNPYRAPGAPVADQDAPAGSPARAVTYGVLVDILGTLASATLIAFIYGIVLAAGGASAEEIERAVNKVDPTSALGLTASAAGFAFSFLGGYVCARVVRHSELKWAAVTGVISAVLGLLFILQSDPSGLNVSLLVLSVAIVMLGGHVGARRNAARA